MNRVETQRHTILLNRLGDQSALMEHFQSQSRSQETLTAAGLCGQLPGIRVKGLMAIMPVADDPEDVRPLFRGMRGWFDRLRDMDLPGVQMRTLSMGMSDDCLVAAEEGATMVRLGRALFGSRPMK